MSSGTTVSSKPPHAPPSCTQQHLLVTAFDSKDRGGCTSCVESVGSSVRKKWKNEGALSCILVYYWLNLAGGSGISEWGWGWGGGPKRRAGVWVLWWRCVLLANLFWSWPPGHPLDPHLHTWKCDWLLDHCMWYERNIVHPTFLSLRCKIENRNGRILIGITSIIWFEKALLLVMPTYLH